MKRLLSCLAALGFAVFTFSSSALRAQDGPPPDQGGGDMAPPPDQGDPNGPPPGDPGDDQSGASFQTFYDNLSNQGTWIQTDQYGYVFQPDVSDPDWAPYTNGRWVYTDEGWTWVSAEPWGWATDHYGRWANLEGTGWCWVPGYQWAPAWVSWRYGGGYAGWAPLPPDAYYGGGGGYHFGGDVDAQFHIGIGFYNFLPVDRLGDRSYNGAYINRGNNVNIYNHTTNITNINVNRGAGGGRGAAFGGVAAGGPPIAEVNAHSSHPVPTVRLATAGAAGRSSLHGSSLAIYAPHVNPATAKQGRPANVARNLGNATLNRSATPVIRNGAGTHTAGAGFENNAAQHPATEGGYHPAATGNANAYHPQAETGQAYHPAAEPQTQVHHTEAAPGSTYHPQAEAGSTYHPQAEAGSAYHAPSQVHHEEHTETHAAPEHTESHAAPPSHHESAPAEHHASAPKPAAKPAGKPAPKDDKKH